MVDVELLGQDPRRQALVLFHGRQKSLIIEIGGAASSGFILQACVSRFESIEPLIDRFSTDCSFAKEVVEVPKCLGSDMAFFEVVEHNMAKVNMVMSTHVSIIF